MRTRGQAAALILTLALLTGSAAGQGQDGAQSAVPRSLLIAWLKDNDAEHPAFLAVIDADARSAGYGQLLTTSPTGMPLQDAHHTQHSLPANGQVFANAFRDGWTFIYDTRVPHIPRLTRSFERIGNYSYPHSFAELPNGNFLSTFQTSGDANDRPGGLVELTPEGELVRASSAATPATGFVRPYSLEIFPAIDRVVSTSADMWGTQATEQVQLWRLSDLALLGTFNLPPGERRNIQQIPLEIRALADGQSALLSTWNCGLYHLTGIAGSRLNARLVWDFSSQACAIPLRLGNYWLQAVGESWQVVALDISDPAQPQLATVLQFPDQFQPHWLAAEPGGNRIAVTGYKAFADRIVLLNWDPQAQNLSVDQTFGESNPELPGFFTNRKIWPHGKTGEATAHGVMFWPAAPSP